VALFYFAAGLLYFDLSFGTNGHLFPLYQMLPGAALFRDPARCTWITAFCLAVLTGIAVDAYATSDAAPSRTRTALLVAIPVIGIAAFYLTWWKPTPGEWWLAGATLAAVLVGRLPRLRLVGGVALAVVLVLDLLVMRPPPFRRMVPDWTLLYAHADVFDWLRARHTPQDRVYVVGEHGDFSLMPKTPALFGMPSVTDYEPQPGRRWSEFYVMMRSGGPMRSLNDFYYGRSTAWFKRRLLDLTAARYVVVGPPPADMVGLPRASLVPLHTSGGVTVYENPSALARARWVHRLFRVPDPGTLLMRLANGPDDLRTGALVEALPASGFFGDLGPDDEGKVTFVSDDFEHVVLQVVAPRRGFVVLADQDVPGWHATVNGEPAEIIRANYTFRAVEVPAGESRVDFRYAPTSVRIGGWVSAVTLVGLLIATVVARRTRARRARQWADADRGEPRFLAE
jgi:hypothetical protein